MRDTAIMNRLLFREEATAVISELTSPTLDKQGVLVAAGGGFGKSSVLAQVVEALHEKSWPVVAMRLDRLTPTNLPQELGKQVLGLEESPVEVLGRLAQGQPCLLVIDQFDMVSIVSARQSSFFDCVKEVIDQVKNYPKMKVLLACRRFDLENDHRLRSLSDPSGIAQVFSLNPFPAQRVRELVAEIGLDPNQLTSKQLQLLGIPLHLGLLVNITKTSAATALNFKTVKDLFDRYWEEKKQAVYRRIAASGWDCDRAVAAIANQMSTSEHLVVPGVKFRKFKEILEALVSEHVLLRDKEDYAFFHESFFDYAFAYSFTASDQDLIEMLLREGQPLFRRAQVRQILLHERDADRERYLHDLQSLISNPAIRFHIKKVVYSLLKDLADPTREEWEIIALPLPSNANLDFTRQPVWNALYGSASWFRLLDEIGLVEEWLSGRQGEAYIDLAINYMVGVRGELISRVIELAEKYFDQSNLWNRRLLALVQNSELLTERPFFELFLQIIDQGFFLNESDGFWHYIYSLPEVKPAWTCEAIGHYFNRWLNQLIGHTVDEFGSDLLQVPTEDLVNLREAVRKPKRQSFRVDERIIYLCAATTPLDLAKWVFPFVVKLIDLTLIREAEAPWDDQIWRYRQYDTPIYTSDIILHSIEIALSQIARDTPETFAQIKQEYNVAASYSETIRYLLIKAYTANPAYFADEAVDYLCQYPHSLEIGYTGNARLATGELLEAITSFCSPQHLSQLEEIIMNYYPNWEFHPRSRAHGYAQYTMLESIAPTRLSGTALRRLQQWRRKFGSYEKILPVVSSGSVHSPVPERAATKMSDNQWLQAIAHYPNEYLHQTRKGLFVGGSHELAGLLQVSTRQEPARFAALVFRFPSGTNLFYFNSVLEGLVDSNLELETVMAVCQYCHNLPNHPCGISICRLIGSYLKKELPSEFIEMLGWYATQDPDPERETWRAEQEGETVYHGGRIIDAGLNSVRGYAADMMANLIFEDANRVPFFLPYLRLMVHNPRISVRAWVAEALTATLNYNRDLAVELFVELCEIDEELLKTETVERFLSYALYSHFKLLEPLIKRMLKSTIEQVVQSATRLVCVVALSREEARPFLGLSFKGSEIQRKGLAEIVARNLSLPSCSSLCENYLIQLFEDENDQVRAATATCFMYLKSDQLGDFTNLVESFVNSQAFEEGYKELVQALERTTAKLPDITCSVCEKLLSRADGAVKDTTSEIGFNVHVVSKIIVRIYDQTTNPQIKQRCLDLLDEMMQKGIYVDQAIEAYERG